MSASRYALMMKRHAKLAKSRIAKLDYSRIRRGVA